MFVKSEGIVLKEIRFRETSKIVTIFSKEYGKVHGMAKGAYRPKNNLISITQPFSYSDFSFFKGKNFYHINQGDLKNSFYPLRENIYKLFYGSYMLELADSSIVEDESNEKLFQLLLKGLTVLSDLKGDYLKFILAYEIKYISFLGYKPYLDKCVLCGQKLEGRDMIFSIISGGILCGNCVYEDLNGFRINLSMLKTLKLLLYTPLDNLTYFKINKEIMFILHDIMVKYILYSIEKNSFNSLNLFKSIENRGGN
jgi:DNA repair protein RecO (recombination protein O)